MRVNHFSMHCEVADSLELTQNVRKGRGQKSRIFTTSDAVMDQEVLSVDKVLWS